MKKNHPCWDARSYQHAGDAFPVDPHETKIGTGMVSATGEAQREPVKRAAVAGEMRLEPDRPGRVVHRPVDGRPAGVVQRRGVHAIAVGGRRPTAADGDRRDHRERPRQPRRRRGERQHGNGLETDGPRD